MKQELIQYFERDLIALKTEINLYENENNLWIIKDDIKNSSGNLALHLIGNLNHFIGATLAKTGYVREREKEFSEKNIPREKILNDIGILIPIVKNTISNLSEQDLSKEFPLKKQDKIIQTDAMLLHLALHLSYHLGQINYHRRLIK